MLQSQLYLHSVWLVMIINVEEYVAYGSINNYHSTNSLDKSSLRVSQRQGQIAGTVGRVSLQRWMMKEIWQFRIIFNAGVYGNQWAFWIGNIFSRGAPYEQYRQESIVWKQCHNIPRLTMPVQPESNYVIRPSNETNIIWLQKDWHWIIRYCTVHCWPLTLPSVIMKSGKRTHSTGKLTGVKIIPRVNTGQPLRHFCPVIALSEWKLQWGSLCSLSVH